MDNFDEVDLNHLLDLVQNHISRFRGWSLEAKILKMLE